MSQGARRVFGKECYVCDSTWKSCRVVSGNFSSAYSVLPAKQLAGCPNISKEAKPGGLCDGGLPKP